MAMKINQHNFSFSIKFRQKEPNLWDDPIN